MSRRPRSRSGVHRIAAVCVDIAHMAQDMLNRGKTLIQIRAAVDSAFGGLAPGTPTQLPPA